MGQRIAYVHSRLELNSARLEFMPFGLSLVKQLDRAGHNIDLYLAETASDRYQKHFSERVNCIFLDQRLVWERPGKLNYFLLTLLFKYLSRGHRYEMVFSSGQAGNVLGHRLAQRQDCPFFYLSDEFPEVYGTSIWRSHEEFAARSADLIIVPDEHRFEKLCHQVVGLENKNWATLPNAPLMDELIGLPEIDWESELELPAGKKLFLQAGGIFDFNQIAESMFTVGSWPEEAALLVNGRENPYAPRSSFEHLDCPGKLFWNLQMYDDPKFHSLVQYSTASFGLYRNQADLDYVGKSSGKIMRSLACGRPVIASDLFSLKFLEELGLGVLVNHPSEIPAAVGRILSEEVEMSHRCRAVYKEQLSFEAYWSKLEPKLSALT